MDTSPAKRARTNDHALPQMTLNDILNLKDWNQSFISSDNQFVSHSGTFYAANLKGKVVSVDGKRFHVLEGLKNPGSFGFGWRAERTLGGLEVEKTPADLFSTTESFDFIFEGLTNVIKSCKEQRQGTCILQTLIDFIKEVETGNFLGDRAQPMDEDPTDRDILKWRDLFVERIKTIANDTGYSTTIDDKAVKEADKLGTPHILCVMLQDLLDYATRCHENRNLIKEIVFLKTYWIPHKSAVGSDFGLKVEKELKMSKLVLEKLQYRQTKNLTRLKHVSTSAKVEVQVDDKVHEIGSIACVVGELVTGTDDMPSKDLFDWCWNMPEIHEEGIARYFFRGVMNGIYELHSARIYHNDLKLENVMVSGNGPTPKIVDYGMVADMSTRDAFTVSRYLSSRPPSVAYLPPETRDAEQGDMVNPAKGDIWCCGVILLQLSLSKVITELEQKYEGIFRYPKKSFHLFLQQKLRLKEDEISSPADSQSGKVAPFKTLEEAFDTRFKAWDGPALRDLLGRMLAHSPGERFSAETVVNHPWTMGVPLNFLNTRHVQFVDSEADVRSSSDGYFEDRMVQSHREECLAQSLQADYPNAQYSSIRGGSEDSVPLPWNHIVVKIRDARL